MSHASRMADALSLAAAPTFAILAVANALHDGGGVDVLCSGRSSLGGMTMMYLLMSGFHLAPWLKRFGRRHAGRGW